MRYLSLLLLALLLCAAVVEPERAGVCYSDDYTTAAPDQPMGYFDGGSL